MEAIITTHDELYQSRLSETANQSVAAKEVERYSHALNVSFKTVRDVGLIRTHAIKSINAVLEGTETGYRKQAGTALRNDQTGEVVYTPPGNGKTGSSLCWRGLPRPLKLPLRPLMALRG